MGCPCENKATTGTPVAYGTIAEPLYPKTCPYTEAQLRSWQQLLFCVKNGELYSELSTTVEEVNMHLGTIISALNYRSSVCYFAHQLAQMEPFITSLIAYQPCP